MSEWIAKQNMPRPGWILFPILNSQTQIVRFLKVLILHNYL